MPQFPGGGNEHGGFTAWLHRRLLRDLGESISVWDQVTLPLGRFSAPEPDLAILKYRSLRALAGPTVDLTGLFEDCRCGACVRHREVHSLTINYTHPPSTM